MDDPHVDDLRGTAVTMLAEAAGSVPEIATITGHAQRILDRDLARKGTPAESAIAKLDEHRWDRSRPKREYGEIVGGPSLQTVLQTASP